MAQGVQCSSPNYQLCPMSKTDESFPGSQTHNNVTLAQNTPALLLRLAQKNRGSRTVVDELTTERTFCGNFMDMILKMV